MLIASELSFPVSLGTSVHIFSVFKDTMASLIVVMI